MQHRDRRPRPRDRGREEEETEAKQAEDKDLLDFVKETLGDQVASVRLSNKLVSSAVCLSTEGGVTLEMERYFKSMPGAPTDIRAIRVLELNANHHAYQTMKEAFDAGDKDKAARIARASCTRRRCSSRASRSRIRPRIPSSSARSSDPIFSLAAASAAGASPCKELSMEPRLGIYIHIPFCASKCGYCDFYSCAGAADRMADYQQALLEAHRRGAGRIAPAYIDTVYFGGGTPSFYGAARLIELLDAVKATGRLLKRAEVTVEVNRTASACTTCAPCTKRASTA